MTVSTTDSRQLIRRWLLDDPALSDAVDGVFGAHLTSSDAQTVLRDRPIVVLALNGGNARPNRELESLVLEVYVYTKGPKEDAFLVYDLVYARLASERIKVAGLGPCGTAREVERPREGRNEDVAAGYVRGVWSLILVAGPEAP